MTQESAVEKIESVQCKRFHCTLAHCTITEQVGGCFSAVLCSLEDLCAVVCNICVFVRRIYVENLCAIVLSICVQ